MVVSPVGDRLVTATGRMGRRLTLCNVGFVPRAAALWTTDQLGCRWKVLKYHSLRILRGFLNFERSLLNCSSMVTGGLTLYSTLEGMLNIRVVLNRELSAPPCRVRYKTPLGTAQEVQRSSNFVVL